MAFPLSKIYFPLWCKIKAPIIRKKMFCNQAPAKGDITPCPARAPPTVSNI